MKSICVLALLTCVNALSAKPDFQCPKQIDPTQSLRTPPVHWKVFSDKVNTRYYLDRIDFYDGPPEEMAHLKPQDDGRVILDSKSKRSYSVVCGYNATSIRLSRELPKGITFCQVNYEKEVHSAGGNPIPLGVSCE